MSSALSARLNRLEAEISPPSNGKLTVSFVWSDEEWEALRRDLAASIAGESDMVLLSVEE